MHPDALAPSRMQNQRLWGAGARFDTPREAVRWLGALQAQEFPLAKWSVAQRTQDATKAALDQAFADGTIVRTHLLRPTWHFVLGEDIRWLLEITAPRVHALNAYNYRQHALDTTLFKKSDSLLAKILSGGVHLTRREVAAALKAGGIRAAGTRLACIVMHAELEAIVCSGAMQGKQHTYALLDERCPGAKPLGRDAALAELTRRYFRSRGPATVNDFARWSSLTAAQGREGIESVGQELESDIIDGRTYWFAPDAIAGRRPARPAVDFVQCYDEIIMSYSETREGSFGMGRGPFMHAVLLDGRLVGHWRPRQERDAVRIDLRLRRALKPAESKALAAAVERYAAFVGGPVRLTAARRRRK